MIPLVALALLAQSSATVPADAKPSQVAATFPHSACGSTEDDRAGLFGESIVSAGDVDQDGVADFAVGAPGHDLHGPYSGVVEIVSGKTKELIRRIEGDDERTCFGWSLANVGDVNGDGRPDLAIGSLWGNAVRIVSGADGSTLRILRGESRQLPAWFGASLANLGDLDGDGVAELAVGAPRDSSHAFVSISNAHAESCSQGGVYVFSGKTGKLLHRIGMREGVRQGVREPEGEFEAPMWSYFGRSIASIGDVDGDHVPDFVVGAPCDPFVHLRGRPNPKRHPERLREFSRPGDLFYELTPVVEELREDTDGGSATLVSGKTGKLIRTLHAHDTSDGFGCSVAGVGDVNGDSVPDVAVGAYRDRTDVEHTGAVRIYSGKDGALLLEVHGQNGTGEFGYSVAGVPDLDGDGRPDLAVGDPLELGYEHYFGAVELISSRNGARIRTLLGNAGSGWSDLGSVIATTSTVDPNVIDSLLVGAPNGGFPGQAYAFDLRDGQTTWLELK